MRRNCRWIGIWLVLGGLAIPQVWAQSDSKITKTIHRAFVLKEHSAVELSNKYGQVIVNTWDADSAVIRVEISGYGKSGDSMDKLINRVDVDFDHFGSVLSAETIFDRNSSVVSQMWNSISDYSKNLVSKNKISVDYEVFIPRKCKLDVTNRYGDLFVDQFWGDARIDVSHGDLQIHELRGKSKVYLSYGKGRFNKLSDAYLELKVAEAYVEEGSILSIESYTSEINLDRAKSVKLNSKNDNLQIGQVMALRGTATFTDIKIDSMSDRVDLTLNYGACTINHINPNFGSVAVQSKHADINFTFGVGSYFQAEIKGKEDQIYLTNSFRGMDKAYDIETKEVIILTGDIGIYKGKKSKVNIEGTGGDIYLFLEESGMSRKK
ncbi:hypothetical protein BFP72_18780 [Reichenbachiella sp. 5M10]|uniref:hypothetical protein n=1 Tax=Reichenbachiella sp. 5M10 TaxID=1889772 RepID=UPI000C1596C2|nr:hypothetical protein [Reichenbachiella sp. 5M10]PIB37309.1 hypothetical protein BFP72_18780 [Reichenbachiella sp. 5M10]